MIRRELKSQLTELEKRYAAAVKAKRDEETAPARWARPHAVRVAAVVLYGEPKIAEPLSDAYSRMQEKLDKQFAAAADECSLRHTGEKAGPFLRGVLCQKLMFDALPGANDNLKFERIFSKAPVWLLHFTGIEWDAKLLGFKLPTLVGAPALGEEARLDRNRWPSLPEGTIDAGGPCSEPDEPWEKIIERRCRELSPVSIPRQSRRLI
jgi:hypothetical protein